LIPIYIICFSSLVKLRGVELLMELTGCHLPYGSHSVTFHLTQVNSSSHAGRPVLDSPTLDGMED